MILPFKQNTKTLTLGVEMEVQLIDPHSLRLAPKAQEILKVVTHKKLTKEMFKSTLELITGVCENVQEVSIDLKGTLQEVQSICTEMDLLLAGTGTHPMADYNNRLISPSPRYHELLDKNQWLIRRMAVYGLHIHLGMANGDECIRFNNFFLHFIPHLIGLSASSPFWRGRDTGLDACRPTTYESHPTSGLPIVVDDWEAFNHLYAQLLQTGSIESMKDIWWDIRPSPGYGTLEIRICDGPATMYELECIVAWVHMLAHWFSDHQELFISKYNTNPREWVIRENKWRGIRYGLQADLIDAVTLERLSMSEAIRNWLERLRPYAQKLEYQPYVEGIQTVLERGNSASRQRNIYASSRSTQDVVRHNVMEFQSGTPIW